MNNRKGREYERTLCFEIDLGETIELGFLREEKRSEVKRIEGEEVVGMELHWRFSII